ncbi:MAG TPA: hypothetical protein VKU00_03010 [Chthonomonadaceae bacterium]|nr:hypothetical protein [Chthonomonadaceae bacterium]
MKVTRAIWALFALVACAFVVGCSAPAEESKPVTPGSGPQQPSATGATGAGGGETGSPKTSNATKPQ